MAEGQPDPVRFPTLIMNGGPLDGTEYPLPLTGKPVVLGSSMDADVQILLGNIEAAHAFIAFGSEGLTLSDAGSATGTFVNGEKVEADRELRDGDRICLGPPGAKGSAKLLLRLPGSTGAPQAAAGHANAPSLMEHGPAPALEGEGGLELAADAFSVEGSAPPDEAHADAPLFSAPLPPPPPAAPQAPAAPPAPPPRAASAPAKPVHAAVPAPPPPAPPAAPPPAPAAAHSARPSTGRPEYSSDLPSIPVAARERENESGQMAEFPPLRPSTRRPTPKPSRGRTSARRRSFLSLPSLPVLPIAAGLVGLAVLVGGGWLLFRSVPPQLVSITPTRTEPGQTVTIAGKGFAKSTSGNTVLFGALRAEVSSATAGQLEVVVPAGARSTMPVVVETRGGRTSPLSVIVIARGEATAVEPDVAMPGQTILLRGQAPSGKLMVLVAGVPATSVQAGTDGVRAVVPEVGLPEGVKTTVTVQTGSAPARSFDLFIGHLPLVQSVKPATGPVGQTITLEGRGFDPNPRADAVTIGGQPALVLSAAPNEIKAVVPAPGAGDFQPELAIVVAAAGSASSGRTTFQLTRSTTSGFRPRFFGAPVTEYPHDDLAFVSTELGPVLLLAGRPGGPGAAERALAAATALNALVDRSSPGQAPAFELRERELAVAVAGNPRPLLTATPEDAAAYSRPWDTGHGAGRRVSAQALARHWTALLQDYLGLFLGRQRPVQFVALSQRARVLSEIYAEASRRAPSERNVPTSVVLPTPPAMATALRQMALVVSTEAPRASVAVEGRWEGSFVDPDRGSQAFQAELRSEAGKLVGTISTHVASIEVRTPLRDVGFERGSLRFTADLMGAAHRFKGTLDHSTVTGTVDRPGKPSLPFTMQFVE